MPLPLFSIAGPTEPLELTLSYHSLQHSFPSVVQESGAGWHHSFGESLRVAAGVGDDFLHHIDRSGAETVYRKNTSGTWSPAAPASLATTISQVSGEYRMVDEHGRTRYFSVSTGRWLGTSDRWGNRVTAEYDANGNLDRVIDAVGRVIDVTEIGGRLTQVVLPGGATWLFGYSSNSLVSIHDPLRPAGGPAWRTFTYVSDSSGELRLLASMRDTLGSILESHTYDNDDRALTSAGADSREEVTIQYDYPTFGNRRVTHGIGGGATQVNDVGVTIRDAQFVATSFSGGGCASCGGGASGEIVTYDSLGRVTERWNALNVRTTYTYDSFSNITRVIEAAGTRLAREITYEYAMASWPGLQTKETRPGPLGSRVRAHTISTDERTVTDAVTGRTAAGGSPVTFTTTTSFDAQHRITSIDGPRIDVADVETRTYYADDDPDANRRGRLATVTANGLTTTYADYDIYGTPRNVTDANGVRTTVTTDALGRTTGSASEPVSGDPAESTRYASSTTYDARDRLSRVVTATGFATVYSYDGSSDVITSTTRLDGSGNEVERLLVTTNNIGWKTSESAQTCSTPAPACAAWVTKRSESYSYDEHGRLSRVTNADGTYRQTTYDAVGRVTAMQDENNSSPNTFYGYDELDRLTSVRQSLEGVQNGATTTWYSYDVLDQLAQVIDPDGNFTTYEYDDFGRVIKQTSPVSGVTTYTYDPAGNLLATTDANAATTTRAYDALNRTTSSVSTRSGSTETITWTYDGGSPSAYARGRVSAMSDPSGTTTFQYERRGLLRNEVKTIESAVYTTSYGYDADGQRTRIVHPSGRVLDYTYDYAGRPLTANSGGVILGQAAKYLPFGSLIELQLGNGRMVARSFDQRYRMTNNAVAGIAGYSYSYDAAGNITAINDNVSPAFNRSFGYDRLHRLTTASSGSALWQSATYSYDRTGNMQRTVLGAAARTFAYQGSTSKLSSATEPVQTRSVTYDSAGNETFVGTDPFVYSPRNHLSTAPGHQYRYDGRGVRTTTLTPPSGTAVVSVTATDNTPGDTGTGTVTLSSPAPVGGAYVALSTDDQRLVNVPPGITVPSGSTSISFPVRMYRPDAGSANVVLRAHHQGSSASASITVLRLPHVQTLTFLPATTEGGTSSGTLALDIPAPAGVSVALSSSNPAAASVPSSITVGAGQSSASFIATTSSVSTETRVSVTASYRGKSVVGTLTVQPVNVEVATVIVSPGNVIGGAMSSVGTVTLNQAARTGGAVITLSSSDPAATVPSSITIAAGASTATFPITTTTVGANTAVAITAIYGTTRTASLTVATCATWVSEPTALGTESPWIDDALVAGATPTGTWIWDTTHKTSGTASHTDGIAAGHHEHGYGDGPSFTVAENDVLVAYVLLDPCNPPQEIMLQWRTYYGWWSHRAYWGANLINQGTDGTNSRRRMGDLPPTGRWIRLEVPAYKVGLVGGLVMGMQFSVYDGRAWFDRIGKAACVVPTGPSPESFPAGDWVWFDDFVLPGAELIGPWTWDTARKASGTQSHTIYRHEEGRAYGFQNGPAMTVGQTDDLFAYAMLSPCEPPRQIMLEWKVGTSSSSWFHRAYWGENLLFPPCGTDGPDCRYMGPLPATGEWVRLEVPASRVDVAGQTVTGMQFKLYGGKAWFDRAGREVPNFGQNLPASSETMIASAETPTQPVRQSVLARLKRWWRARREPEPATPVSFTVYAQLAATNTSSQRRKHSFYTPELQLMSETEFSAATAPAIAYDYVWFNGEPLAQIENSTGSIAWYFNDHLGAPLLQMNNTGVEIWRVEREPYGEPYQYRTAADRHQPLGLPGQELDREQRDRQYNIHRWYRPAWGRYTSADPLGPRGDPHPYAYGAANPLVNVDPAGEKSRVCCTPIVSKTWLSYFHHCFIQSVDNKTGGSTTYALHNMGLLSRWGCKFKGAKFDKDAIGLRSTSCGAWKEDCGTDQCVEKADDAYPQSVDYGFITPNSNTYASHVARACGLQPPSLVNTSQAPGWGSPQPKTFPGKVCPPTPPWD